MFETVGMTNDDIRRKPKSEFTTEGAGLLRFDGRSFLIHSACDGVAANFIRAMYQDKGGILWLALRDGGVSRFDGKSCLDYRTWWIFSPCRRATGESSAPIV